MKDVSSSNGPSWWDIRQTTATIERTHHVKVLCQATLHAPETGPWYHWWTVQACVGGVAASAEVRGRVAERFPNSTNATLPGLLYRLLLSLDAKLSAQESTAEQQAMF